MFIGHYAPAFLASALIAKNNTKYLAAETTSRTAHNNAAWLGVMFVAAQLVDFGFFGLALLGIENMRVAPGISVMVPFDLYDMPFTHSLLGSVIWGAAFAAIIALFSKNRFAALAAFGVVVSHWFLDLIVHVPDLTLAGGEDKMGFGLWNHPWIEMPFEIGLTALSFAYYLYCTRMAGKQPIAWPAILALILIAVQMVNWFGPVPEQFSPDIAWSALAAFAVLALLAHMTARQRAA